MWRKGHTPNIEDTEIQEAVKTMGMLESGITINQDELPAWEGELITMIKSKMNQKERQEFAEQTV